MAHLVLTLAVAAGALLQDVQATFQTDILGDLNKARQNEHVTKQLSWSVPLATQSKSWVTQCKWQHSGIAGASEIIYMTSATNLTPTKLAQSSVHTWMSEKVQPGCDCATGANCGHYCIIINNRNVKVGCAMQKCSNIDGKPGSFVVCRLSA